MDQTPRDTRPMEAAEKNAIRAMATNADDDGNLECVWEVCSVSAGVGMGT